MKRYKIVKVKNHCVGPLVKGKTVYGIIMVLRLTIISNSAAGDPRPLYIRVFSDPLKGSSNTNISGPKSPAETSTLYSSLSEHFRQIQPRLPR